jgi:4-amino-4-deoxy-L-arabinose transferase-like glycosyltransferase
MPILLAAAFVRIYSLDSHSLLIDEAFVAVGARDIAYHHTPIWDASSVGPYSWLQALWFDLFGDSGAWSVRLMPAIQGTFTVLCVYLIAQRIVEAKLALASAAVMALHPFAVAFARIGFVDTLQLLLILLAILLGELLPQEESLKRKILIVGIGAMWCAAFLIKFNAPVFALAWWISGVAAKRFKLRDALLQFASMLGWIGLSLFVWRYGLVPWFGAFLMHGATYNLLYSLSFFSRHAQQAFLGITLPVLFGSIAFAYFRKEARESSALMHCSLATLIYLFEVLVLGRPFQRYLLICTSMFALLFPLLLSALWRDAKVLQLRKQVTGSVALYLSSVLLFLLALFTSVNLYKNYLEYLHNDVSVTELMQDVRKELRPDQRVFWSSAEPIAAYYSGFSQQYSRAKRGWLGPELGYATFTEGMHVSYATDSLPYRVRVAQDELRRVGYWHLILHPEYLDTIVADATLARSERDELRSGDYLQDTTVRSGDLLIVFGGERSLNGEPRFEPLDTSKRSNVHLPLDNYEVLSVYRPSGRSNTADTLSYPYTAGAWLLRHK